MLARRWSTAVCGLALALAFLVAGAFYAAGAAGLIAAEKDEPAYLAFFSDDRVHELDIAIDDWEAFLSVAPEERYVRADVTLDGHTVRGVGLRAKGNNSKRLVEQAGHVRYGLKIEFDHYEDGLSYLGLDKLSLDASFQDNSYLKTYVALDMMAFMGVPTPEASFVQVSVNGQAWGLYLAVEDPEDAFAERVFGQDHGMLYKPDYRWLSQENADVALRYTGDDPALYDNILRTARFDLTQADVDELIGALRALSAGEDLEGAVDVEEVLRYFAVQSFVVNLDSYLGRTGHNYLLYVEGGRLSMLPWDYNLAFGTYALGREELPDDATTHVNQPIDTPAAGEVMLGRPLYHNLLLVDEYHARYRELLDELVGGYFESGRFEAELARVAQMISPYVAVDPTAFVGHAEFLEGVDALREFCRLRAQSVRAQLSGAAPATTPGQEERPGARVDALHLDLRDLGCLEDLLGG
mgnify:CR=1 FL=1